MIQATLMMALRVRGFRSFLQNSRRRRRRCVACKWSIVTTSFLLAPAHHPQRMELTGGPLQQKTETDDYTLCLDPIEVLSIGSASPRSGPRASPRRGGLRPLCGETVEGLTPPRFGRTKTECEELIPLSTRDVDGDGTIAFQGLNSLEANFFLAPVPTPSHRVVQSTLPCRSGRNLSACSSEPLSLMPSRKHARFYVKDRRPACWREASLM